VADRLKEVEKWKSGKVEEVTWKFEVVSGK
jgi:hypothetical protein